MRPFPAVGAKAFSMVALDADALSRTDRLDDALKQVPGLSLFRRSTSVNANPTTQGVSLRSIAPSGAGRALVLLDGVPVNDPFGGWVIWSALPWEDLGGAQILRGAGTGPYGAGALTGTIMLDERENTRGISVADAEAGSLGTYRAGISGGASLDDVDFFGHLSGERSNGWIPVDANHRGAADNHLWLDSASGSLRAQTMFGDVAATARIGFYDEARGAGLVGAEAKAHGTNASLTFKRDPDASALGWRIQLWMIQSGFSNTSVSVPASRAFTTPANDQYATPAMGYGLNASLLDHTDGPVAWEIGSDIRVSDGETRELFRFMSGAFRNNRRAGGKLVIAGLYGEISYDAGPWLFTAGVRGDYWATSQGHLVEKLRSTGAITKDQDFADRDGIVPTGRLGLRRAVGDGDYLRVAAYNGFRPATLNELYRPFRVGNDVTNANAGLIPERLYGAEAGWGGQWNGFTWNTTLFWNRLHDAIANVTIGVVHCGPVVCGVLRQRQNAGDVDALGVEGDVGARLNDAISLHGAFSVTDARFVSGQLNGKRPAQAPRITVTGSASWQVRDDLALDADVRWESSRFEDDLNSLRLGSALEIDARAMWKFGDSWAAYLAIDNALDADIATGETTGHVVSFASPRVLRIGLTYSP
ncbi:MAG: TonB-dependent receptor [Proteobacteria bacterium]|nr:TonB-dependent receptor [Pseudomonadota bacterium]